MILGNGVPCCIDRTIQENTPFNEIMMHIWIDARAPHAFEKIYSLTLLERILRQLFELGVRQDVTVILLPNVDVANPAELTTHLRKDFWARYPLAFDTLHAESSLLELVNAAPHSDQPVMLLEADGIYDERILTPLLASQTSLYIHDPHHPKAPLAVVLQSHDRQQVNSDGPCLYETLSQAVSQGRLQGLSIASMDSYIPDLRQHAVPFLLRLDSPARIRAIENDMYEKTFKGVMDFIATYIYRIPVRGLVRLCAPTRITPNLVTAMSVLCSFAAIPLFALGWVWAGFLAAYTFVICDSLDGKLARLTIRLSKLAGQIDHGTSSPFEACYYLAWAWHFSGGDLTARPGPVALLLFGFFCVDKITTGTFSRRFHHSLFDYKPWDARFHLVAGRRTINLSIMAVGCALQQPSTALAITAIWMFSTMSWHMARFTWHATHGAHNKLA